MKHVLRASIAWWKLRQPFGFGRIPEQIRPASQFSRTLPGYEATENMFCFFYKSIIFDLKKEKKKKTIQKARMYSLITFVKL